MNFINFFYFSVFFTLRCKPSTSNAVYSDNRECSSNEGIDIFEHKPEKSLNLSLCNKWPPLLTIEYQYAISFNG